LVDLEMECGQFLALIKFLGHFHYIVVTKNKLARTNQTRK